MRLPSLLALILFMVAILSSCAMIDRYTGEDVNQPVRETGVGASAQVLEIWETGVTLNDNPIVGFRLQVTLEDGTRNEAETRNVVSLIHIPQVQPGATLPVKVDPENRQRVALDLFPERR